MEFIHLILIVSITIATIITLVHLLFRHHGNKGLPPGPAGLPLFGRLPFLNPDLHRALADMARSYGPIVSFRLGTVLCVAITSPSAAMDVLKHHDSVFANHTAPIVGTIVNGGLNIVWAPNGPHWRMLRKVAARDLLSTPVVESFQFLRRRVMHEALGMLRGAEGNDVADIRNIASRVTLDITLGMMCEETIKEEEGCSSLKKELLDVTGSIVEILAAFNISDYVPALMPLDLQGLQRRMKVMRLHWDAVFERMKSLKAGGNGAEGGAKDFLQLMMDLVQSKDSQTPLQLEHVQAVMMDMIIGGTDTTSTTVEWAMSELMCNPEAMVRVQKELDLVVGRDGTFEESHISKVQYLEAVVKETFRLHPVLPLLVPHTASATCQVGGYTVPEGSRVFINVWAIQRDPSVWKDPIEFRPERFLDDPNHWDYHGKSFNYFPFGAGRRICAGVNLGERLVMYLLGSLLHSFDWHLPRATIHVDLEEKFGFVMKKKEPLVLVPTPRMAS